MRVHFPNPTVLACGSTRHNIDSGSRLKLAALTNLSGTNLDAGGAAWMPRIKH